MVIKSISSPSSLPQGQGLELKVPTLHQALVSHAEATVPSSHVSIQRTLIILEIPEASEVLGQELGSKTEYHIYFFLYHTSHVSL